MTETITFETTILSGADDVEQGTAGAVIFGSSDLEMAVDRTVVQTVGLRFTGIDIPQGAIITSIHSVPDRGGAKRHGVPADPGRGQR